MTYSRDTLLSDIQAGKNPDYLFFWGHRAKPGGIGKSCLSQWWACEFKVDGATYLSAEHWMMAEKARLFSDEEIRQQIIDCKEPDRAKGLGRRVRNFDSALWDAEKFNIVVSGNLHKFSQNPALRAFLLSTGDKVLVEASPVDPIWGIGLHHEDERASDPKQWMGENLLGFALMVARDQLRD